jgi:hypothetical protein
MHKFFAHIVVDLLRFRAKAYSYSTKMGRGKSPYSGTGSDLEEFSRNPADGSFAALPGRTAAKTNYLTRGSSRTKRNYRWGDTHQ